MRLLCLAPLSLLLRSGPPGQGPPAPCSLTNILHVQQQIKTDQADCYRSYTGVPCPRLAGPDGLWTPVVFINNSIQLLASRGQWTPGYVVAGRWGSCDTAEMRQHGEYLLPRAPMTSGDGGLTLTSGARGKEGVSPLSGEVQEEGVTWGKCPVNIMREPQVATTHTLGALSALYRKCIFDMRSEPSPPHIEF